MPAPSCGVGRVLHTERCEGRGCRAAGRRPASGKRDDGHSTTEFNVRSLPRWLIVDGMVGVERAVALGRPTRVGGTGVGGYSLTFGNLAWALVCVAVLGLIRQALVATVELLAFRWVRDGCHRCGVQRDICRCGARRLLEREMP